MPKDMRYKEFEFAEGWPSVSTIVGQLDKPFLCPWYGNMAWEEAQELIIHAKAQGWGLDDVLNELTHNKPSKARRISDHSKVIGNAIDSEICRYYGDEKIAEVDMTTILKHPESKAYYYQALQNFYKLAELIKPKSLLGQQVVYSKKHKYIGTFDRLLLIDGKLVLSDWKAANSVNYTYLMQLEGYYRALTEMLDSGILKLDGKYEWHEYPLWLVQFPKKEEVDFAKHITKFKPKEKRFENFLNLLHFYIGKREDEQEAKDSKPKKEKKVRSKKTNAKD